MDTKQQVHNLIILDESGSMFDIKGAIIKGFNEIVETVKGIQDQFPEQEHFISFMTFNGVGQKFLLFNEPVNKLEKIDENKYLPNASTPLFDAMGNSFNKMKQLVAKLTDFNVLVTILTDGEENASKEYSGILIKAMIDELKQNRWTFTYIGTDHDVEKFAMSISITNTMVFEKNEENMNYMFSKEKEARSNYSSKIRNNEETSDGFYEKEKE